MYKKYLYINLHNIDLMEMDESYEFDDHLLNSSKGVYIAIFLIISISALIEVKHSIIKINLIKEEYKTITIKAFTNDHLCKHFFDIFLYFTGLIIDLNILIFYIFELFQNLSNLIKKKIQITWIYLNYI